jgi:hypothetical protein
MALSNGWHLCPQLAFLIGRASFLRIDHLLELLDRLLRRKARAPTHEIAGGRLA